MLILNLNEETTIRLIVQLSNAIFESKTKIRFELKESQLIRDSWSLHFQIERRSKRACNQLFSYSKKFKYRLNVKIESANKK